ncbi:MAG: hypothetical protein MRY74_01875 [Neomegalonema sp.]|nr:hypothetical protein [Neomegalonema sp.]
MKTISMPLLVSARTMQNMIGRAKSDLDTARVEAVTSRAADIGEHLGGDTGSVHRIDKMIADAERRLTSLTELQIEAENVQQKLTSVQEVALGLGVEIESALGLENTQALSALTTESEAELTAIWGRLNANFNGEYQFSGAATDTPPLGDLATFVSDIKTIVSGAASAGAVATALDTYFNDTVAGAFHTTVYQGSTAAGPDKEVSDSRRLGLDVKVTDDGVRNVLRGLALMVAADDATTTDIADQLKSDAARTLSNGGALIINQQSQIGGIEADVKSLTSRNEAEKSSYEFLLLDKIGVDQYEAASRMTLLETQLEATYLTTSRISRLSLVNYI